MREEFGSAALNTPKEEDVSVQPRAGLPVRELHSNSLQRATPDENQLTQRVFKGLFTLFAHLSFYFPFYLYLKPSSFAIFTGNHQLILLHFPLECVPNSFLIHFVSEYYFYKVRAFMSAAIHRT